MMVHNSRLDSEVKIDRRVEDKIYNNNWLRIVW